MTDNMKQLKHRLAEIARLNEQLPQLKQSADAALAMFKSSRASRPAYPHEALAPYSQAKTEIEEHRKEVARLQRLVEWEEGVKNAPASIKAARKAMDTAQAELRQLEAKRTALAGKLESMQASQRHEREAAQAQEQEAARLYAEALATDDKAAEQRAQVALEAATNAVAACTGGQTAATAVAEALAGELDKLQAGIDEARQRHDDARREVLLAARYLWAAKLDRAARDLANIAAHVAAADKALGFNDALSELHLPLLAPNGPRYLGSRYLTEARAEIGLEQLTAA